MVEQSPKILANEEKATNTLLLYPVLLRGCSNPVCNTHPLFQNLDYLMRVMLPEALMMVHKQVTEHPSSELGNC